MLCLAALQPAQRALAGVLRVLVGRRIFHALVEGHRNVAAKIRLDAHTLLRPHEDAVTVKVRGKRHPLFLDFSQARKGKYLKPAAVRQDRAIPIHEPVKTTHPAHGIVARAQMQVVSVGKLDLAAEILQVKRAHAALDGRLRADIHKDRRLYLAAVRASKFAAPRAAFIFDDLKHTLSSTLKK